VNLSSNDVARAFTNGVVVSGEGTTAVMMLNRVFACGGHGVLCFRGGNCQVEQNEIRMCEKAAVAVMDSGTKAVICANQLIVPSPHVFDHIETDGLGGLTQYSNTCTTVGSVGKLISEGSLTGVTSQPPKQRMADDIMTALAARENDYRFEAYGPGEAVPWPELETPGMGAGPRHKAAAGAAGPQGGPKAVTA
jgi:hypothetical protein